jgi:hypothetical protein
MKKKPGMPCVLLLAACILAGCVSIGESFKTGGVQGLELGQLRSSDYAAIFGKPTYVVRTNTANGEYEVDRYGYARANPGNSSVRMLDLEFKNGGLNAFYYLSSFSEDETKADSDSAKKLAAGQTKEEVLRIMGRPAGKALCPTTLVDFKEQFGKVRNGTEIWAWCYIKRLVTFGNTPNESTTIYVVFDTNGKVVDAVKVEGRQR